MFTEPPGNFMLETEFQLPWVQAGFLKSSSDWIDQQLNQVGLIGCGLIEPTHVVPWSAVYRVPTNDGDLYFKVCPPAFVQEVRVTQLLSLLRPEILPDLIAVHPENGWLLMRDGGPTLRSYKGSDLYLVHWQRVLPLYAGLQQDLETKSHDLLDAGAMDRRLSLLPEKFEILLADTESLLIDHENGLSSRQYGQLVDNLPSFKERCSRLNSFGLPETIQHDDFHCNNIFAGQSGYRFFDWGESCVAHPFFSMVVTMRSIAYHQGLESLAPELTTLRNRYLEAWGEYLDWGSLLEAYELAVQLGAVNRALTWYRLLLALPEPYRSDEAESVPGWLLEYLDSFESFAQ